MRSIKFDQLTRRAEPPVMVLAPTFVAPGKPPIVPVRRSGGERPVEVVEVEVEVEAAAAPIDDAVPAGSTLS